MSLFRPLSGRHAQRAAWCAAVLAASHGTSLAQAQTPPRLHMLSLQASASTEVTQDVLRVQFAISRDGTDAQAVQTQLKQALDAALAEARKIAKPGQVEVRTGAFSLYPRYASKGGINGWQGSAEMVVEGKDTAAIAQLTGRIKSMQISRVGYELSREAREKVEAEVTARAIAAYKARAADYARQFGYSSFQIGEVTVNAENHYGGGQPEMMRASLAKSYAEDAPLPVEAGKTTVSVNVNGSVLMSK